MYVKRPSSIARNFIIISAALVISGCASTTKNETSNSACLVKRAAFDVGSGSTKMVVAEVDKCEHKLVSILLEAQRGVPFKEALIQAKDNNFNSDIKKKAVNALGELKKMAKDMGATDFSAMATSAFRTAGNGAVALKEISDKTKIKMRVINQETEARFGYLGALGHIKNKNESFMVWDIGGGSQQMTKNIDGKWNYYLGKIASVSFKDAVLKKYYNKNAQTPNPLRKERALRALQLSKEYAKKVPVAFRDLSDTKVYGIGGVHYYSLRNQTKIADKIYNQEDLYRTLMERSQMNDKELGGEYSQTDVTNIALVLGHMQSLNISNVEVLKVNMAHGLLIDEASW